MLSRCEAFAEPGNGVPPRFGVSLGFGALVARPLRCGGTPLPGITCPSASIDFAPQLVVCLSIYHKWEAFLCPSF